MHWFKPYILVIGCVLPSIVHRCQHLPMEKWESAHEKWESAHEKWESAHEKWETSSSSQLLSVFSILTVLVFFVIFFSLLFYLSPFICAIHGE